MDLIDTRMIFANANREMGACAMARSPFNLNVRYTRATSWVFHRGRPRAGTGRIENQRKKPSESAFSMGKHTRKRLRKDKSVHERAVPLGAAVLLDDEIDKDDEERKLESLLFGKPPVARRERITVCEEEASGSDNDVEANAAELEGLLDSDVSHGWRFVP